MVAKLPQSLKNATAYGSGNQVLRLKRTIDSDRVVEGDVRQGSLADIRGRMLSGNAKASPRLRPKGSTRGELRRHEPKRRRFDVCGAKALGQPRSRSDCG